MRPFEGANCADLPAFVIDKYFGSNAHLERFNAEVARAICSHCVVLELCRDEALTMYHPPKRGIIAGISAHELSSARRWRMYEQGLTDQVPRPTRPSWLTQTDATERAEQSRLEADPDEPPPEI